MGIAICDDEAPARAYLASLIRAQNCPCEIVEHACAGDCLAEAREIDLLFLDIELDSSGPDGMGLARQIRARPAAVQPYRVYMMASANKFMRIYICHCEAVPGQPRSLTANPRCVYSRPASKFLMVVAWVVMPFFCFLKNLSFPQFRA